MDTLFWITASLLTIGGGATGAVQRTSLEGELLYPACVGVPEDLLVCAEDARTQARICTSAKFDREGPRYRLDVKPGVYRVYAESQVVRPGYRAYYSEAVRCGLRVDCPSHTPITVSVEAGRTHSGINPADWFNVPETKGVLAWSH